MNTFPVHNCSPVLTPQTQFQDRFGHPNAYFDMNPSLTISSSGEFTILVRRINYRKFQDRQFILYEPKSISSYTVLRGTISKTGSVFSSTSMTDSPLTVQWTIPSHPTYWLGIEDVRFCDSSTVLFAAPEKNPSGNPCIFRGTLEGSTIHSIVRCEPSSIEKNWMPFEVNGIQSVVYSVYPFQIKDITSDTKQTIATYESLQEYHGSTNGIVYNTVWRLFLIHRNKERTIHRWLLYNPISHEIRYSEPFVFFQYSYIEFPCSLCEYNGLLYVSLGVNDDKAYVLTIEKSAVESSFSVPTA